MTTIKNLNNALVSDDFSTPLKDTKRDADGRTVETDEYLTVRTCLKRAALINDDDNKMSTGDKFDNWLLAKRIHEAGESVTITKAEDERLRSYIGRAYGALAVGQLLSQFSNDSEVKAE